MGAGTAAHNEARPALHARREAEQDGGEQSVEREYVGFSRVLPDDARKGEEPGACERGPGRSRLLLDEPEERSGGSGTAECGREAGSPGNRLEGKEKEDAGQQEIERVTRGMPGGHRLRGGDELARVAARDGRLHSQDVSGEDAGAGEERSPERRRRDRGVNGCRGLPGSRGAGHRRHLSRSAATCGSRRGRIAAGPRKRSPAGSSSAAASPARTATTARPTRPA